MVLTAAARAAALRCAPVPEAVLFLAAVPPRWSDPAGLTVHGRVELRRPLGTVARRPSVAELGMPPGHDVPDRSRCVVYFEVAPQGAFEPLELPRAVLDQRNQAFVPYVLAITVGTTVEFPNDDDTYHNVFSLSKARRFDLGRYPRGRSKSIRFDQAGVVRVFCELHSHMSAYILVLAHRYFAMTDAAGDYQIGDVPPGTYTLAVWRDGSVRARRTLHVPEDAAQDQNFSVD